MKVTYKISGKVQGVMFRQTVIRAAHKRNLEAGATNLPSGNEVSLSIIGSEEEIADLINALSQQKPINSWNATPLSLEKVSEFVELNDHQVTTKNVDEFNWSSGVEFYI